MIGYRFDTEYSAKMVVKRMKFCNTPLFSGCRTSRNYGPIEPLNFHEFSIQLFAVSCLFFRSLAATNAETGLASDRAQAIRVCVGEVRMLEQRFHLFSQPVKKLDFHLKHFAMGLTIGCLKRPWPGSLLLRVAFSRLILTDLTCLVLQREIPITRKTVILHQFQKMHKLSQP